MLIGFVIIKLVMGLQNFIYKKPTFAAIKYREFHLEDIYDDVNQTFTLIDKFDTRFSLRPREGCRAKQTVIMALSAPQNTQVREYVRSQLAHLKNARVIFLLGKVGSSQVQEQLHAEHLVHGDILQNTVIDAYNTLAYKTLGAFVWINRYCGNAAYVMKIDDDVTINFDTVFATLENKYPDGPPPTIECPSIMRNMRPWRHNHTNTIMGKWSISRDQMPRRVFADFCPGWFYITTPEVGLALAYVAKETVKDLKGLSGMDDIYITGHLRERLPWVNLSPLQSGGLSGLLWGSFLSHCPYLGITKNVFFNDVVLEKKSGKIPYTSGQKFFACAFLEYFILENLEYINPSLAPEYLWQICDRSS